MRTRTILLVLLFCSGVAADNLEKTQKKELEAQVKTLELRFDIGRYDLVEPPQQATRRTTGRAILKGENGHSSYPTVSAQADIIAGRSFKGAAWN